MLYLSYLQLTRGFRVCDSDSWLISAYLTCDLLLTVQSPSEDNKDEIHVQGTRLNACWILKQQNTNLCTCSGYTENMAI